MNATAVYGIASLIVWAVVLVVLVKYVASMMRADNDGEGGIMALVSLLARERRPIGTQRRLILPGIIGAALFVGDSPITPASSVLSAVQGVELVGPSFTQFVLPVLLGSSGPVWHPASRDRRGETVVRADHARLVRLCRPVRGRR